MRQAPRLFVLVLLGSLVGCAELKQMISVQGQAEFQGLRRMFGVSDPDLTHSQRYNLAMERRDYAGALTIARQEIATPEKNSVDYLVTIRVAAIGAMTKYADMVGLNPAMDREVVHWYKEALGLAKDNEKKQANIYNYVALYFDHTNRPGIGVQFAILEMSIWERRKNPYRTYLAYANLSSLYALMGDFPNKRHYRKLATDLAKQIYNLDSFNTPNGGDGNEWLNYSIFLERQLFDLEPGPGSVDEAFRLFSRYERIAQRKLTPVFPAYLTFATVLIKLGQVDLGLSNLKRANRTAQAEIANKATSEEALVCARSPIHLALGYLNEAREDIQRCLAMDPSSERSIPFQRYAGLTYEASGNLDQAIQAFEASTMLCEQSRQSFALAQRATFFNNACRHSFFGLIRVLARRFLATNNPRDFIAALRATERMRARQFGEVLESRHGQPLRSPDLLTLQNALASDELLLDYILADKEIIVFSVTKENFTVVVQPYDANKADERSQELAQELNSPGHLMDSESTQQRLAALSAPWLTSVQDGLKTKKRLVVLLDGAMYRIPFDLLPLDGHALVESKSVRMVPSLRYLVWARGESQQQAATGFFALADPVFTTQSLIPGLTQETPASATVTRGGQWVRSFAPLPDTRTEVEAIAALFNGESVRVLLGQDARESALKKLDLRDYRYLHIATHGFGGGEVPGISEPALAFSDESDQDGVLLASEAEQLRLRTDLTVLSACRTGVGEIYPGEGVIGLSRSFLLAGSRSVLVSLWEVNSKATSAFMVDFYRRLREGGDAAEALQKTKLAMLHNEGAPVSNAQGAPIPRQDPYYWAPFVLVAP